LTSAFVFLASDSPWTFGWDALVAIGTFALAAVTFILALITRSVAKATKEEVESQSYPVLLAVNVSPTKAIRIKAEALHLRIRNGGQGPAFEVKCRLQPGNLAPDHWSQGILEPRQEALLSFPRSEAEEKERYELHSEYTDLAGRAHKSRVVIQLGAHKVGNELRRRYTFQEVEVS
jgi:hypothetical protein